MFHKVFVYGTLKRGEPNHSWFSKSKDGVYRLLGLAKTVEKYPLIIGTEYNIPFLLDSPGTGANVEGELYEVDDKVFRDLDELEDHPNFYIREKCKLNTENGEVIAWSYFIKNFNTELLKKPFLISYSNNGPHGLKYVERYLRIKNFKGDIFNNSSENATLEDLNKRTT